MLKRLELVGFKSFAEKTLFDFGAGLTAIVGPNGSGKSNIVDAIRWILGEQSAKSLRGGEMADVIFNGSSTRRSLGLAEVTLTLDNSRRQFAFDADEVQITRRVYRNGEGEYLINKLPSRLRDIKELFLGSGAGADAYCIIEQGRVDVLLQASNQERRGIFEEAAGISRIRAKKIETQRKLERVEQNLLRLHDIIEEVERQLRSVKLQAAKAQRYREHMVRIKELRIALGLDECHQLSAALDQVTGELEEQRKSLAERNALAGQIEAELRKVEQLLAEQDTALRREEAGVAAAQQRIAAEETTLKHERALTTELETELTRTRTQLLSFGRQLASLTTAASEASQELETVERDCQNHRETVAQRDADLTSITGRLAELRKGMSEAKIELMEEMRREARLHNEQVSLRAQADSLQQQRQRLTNRTTLASASLSQLSAEVQTLDQAERQLHERLDFARHSLLDLRKQRDLARSAVENTGGQLAGQREQRSGLASRIQILENLERSHEGLSAGVQEVLQLLESRMPGAWKTILGLIADYLNVEREHAALVDIALGERAHQLLVRDRAALDVALSDHPQLAGRVSFRPLVNVGVDELVAEDDAPLAGQPPAAVEPEQPNQLPDYPGVLGLAAKLVSCTHPDLQHLPDQLLGRTLVVKDVACARAVAAMRHGWRFLTLAGELLETDGVLTVGRHHAESGIVSRKSELRDLQRQAVALDTLILRSEQTLSELRGELARLDSQEEESQQASTVLSEQSADLRLRLVQARERHEGLAQEVQLGQAEIQQITEELSSIAQAQQQTDEQTQASATRVQGLHEQLATDESEVQTLEQSRHASQQALTAARVAQATAEERHSALARRHQQADRDWQDRQAEQRRQQDQVASLVERLFQSQQTMLRASSRLAHAFVEKETGERHIRDLQAECERLRTDRRTLSDRVQAVRQQAQELQEQVHGRELQVSDLQHQLKSLTDKLKEEHDVDLLELYRGASAPYTLEVDGALPSIHMQRAAAEEECAELRRKIARLGSVNLDALQELDELENRSRTLQAQHDDLTAAKKSLDEIIAKINQDSRKLFADTFNTVRGHFQELFRKLFGGGMADVILENEADILESGIEIIARPPGKELRSISLLSGGEKTLTAVALLLAIFRSKPSPFCVLDEVDAALDEANIGRFAAVLREFLDQSQFILITHSKKTMATADVLYGITMQEAGISKRVAVRLEDWPEEGAQPGPRMAEGTGPLADQAEDAA
jgi:chromosome segregation protein